MKILLFGKNGQLGKQLFSILKKDFDLIALQKNDNSPYCGNLLSLSKIKQTINKIKPNIIINASAYTNVDKAERSKADATNINEIGPGIIAESAKLNKSLFIHFSTDYVFDGKKNIPFKEIDKTSPINFYGLSKLRGEKRIIDSKCNFLIFRVGWLYSENQNNFLHSICNIAFKQKFIKVVSDQFGTPTSSSFVSQTIFSLLKNTKIMNNKCSNVFHLAPDGFCSRFEFAEFIIKRLLKKRLLKSMPVIYPQKTEQLKSLANRPLNTRLDSGKLKKEFDLKFPNWKIDVDKTIDIIYKNSCLKEKV